MRQLNQTHSLALPDIVKLVLSRRAVEGIGLESNGRLIAALRLQLHNEGRADTYLALDGDIATHQLNETLANAQPKSSPSIVLGCMLLQLVEVHE